MPLLQLCQVLVISAPGLYDILLTQQESQVQKETQRDNFVTAPSSVHSLTLSTHRLSHGHSQGWNSGLEFRAPNLIESVCLSSALRGLCFLIF